MLLTFEFLFALLPDGGAGGTFFGTTFSPCFVRVLILGVPARMVTWPRAGGLGKKANIVVNYVTTRLQSAVVEKGLHRACRA